MTNKRSEHLHSSRERQQWLLSPLTSSLPHLKPVVMRFLRHNRLIWPEELKRIQIIANKEQSCSWIMHNANCLHLCCSYSDTEKSEKQSTVFRKKGTFFIV